MGVIVGTHILTNDATPDVLESSVPTPEACCRLCSGANATQKLYMDISRTTQVGCPIFFLSYATNVGWICQFHSENGTVASSYDTASIAYLPA